MNIHLVSKVDSKIDSEFNLSFNSQAHFEVSKEGDIQTVISELRHFGILEHEPPHDMIPNTKPVRDLYTEGLQKLVQGGISRLYDNNHEADEHDDNLENI
ncbi:hypothetical protein BX616_008946 [Lobosporangium transversale]|nr:hypothetical protein BX616_008946 [Lobosporangium transversale]